MNISPVVIDSLQNQQGKIKGIPKQMEVDRLPPLPWVRNVQAVCGYWVATPFSETSPSDIPNSRTLLTPATLPVKAAATRANLELGPNVDPGLKKQLFINRGVSLVLVGIYHFCGGTSPY